MNIPKGHEEALAELKRIEGIWNKITALLALPTDAKPEDILEAVRICVRRCEALELERSARLDDEGKL